MKPCLLKTLPQGSKLELVLNMEMPGYPKKMALINLRLNHSKVVLAELLNVVLQSGELEGIFMLLMSAAQKSLTRKFQMQFTPTQGKKMEAILNFIGNRQNFQPKLFQKNKKRKPSKKSQKK